MSSSLRISRVIGGWVEDGRVGDWLHPNYGPVPHFAAIYSDPSWDYLAAVWRLGAPGEAHPWVSVVEGPQELCCALRTYHWRVTSADPLLVSTNINRGHAADMHIPKDGRPLRMLAKMSVMLFRKEVLIE